MTDYTGIAAAGAVANGGKDKDSSSSVLATARSRLDMAIGALSESREDEIDDLKFYAGSPDNHWQWPADVLATRGAVQGQTINARPTLTINKLPQHVRQVTNDQRQNRPSGKVIPADDRADPEVAEIYNGMVRHIEYISDADVAYDTACENQILIEALTAQYQADLNAIDKAASDERVKTKEEEEKRKREEALKTANEETCYWESPVPYPTDDKFYIWDEDQQQWTEVEIPE